MERDEFRFSSKKEYEVEISRILCSLNAARASRGPGSAKDTRRKERQYDELVEEYVRFCGSGGRKDGQ